MDDSGPVVIVELPADAAASSNTAALIDACTVALRRGACTLARGQGSEKADAIAVVTFRSSDPTDVLVEVRAEHKAAGPASREIAFRPEDSETEKWRSIGFTIASLAGALGVQEAAPRAPEPPPAPPEPPRERNEARRTPPARYSPLRVGARFELGPGLDRGPVRLGGALLAAYDLPGRVLSVSALAGSAVRPGAVGNVNMAWTRLGIGISVAVPIPPAIEGRLSALVVLERLSASEKDPASGVEETKSRWLSGVELDGAVRFPRATRFGALIGGFVVRLPGGTAVESHGAALASSPATERGFFAGMEVRL